jgi:hypothetical protein
MRIASDELLDINPACEYQQIENQPERVPKLRFGNALARMREKLSRLCVRGAKNFISEKSACFAYAKPRESFSLLRAGAFPSRREALSGNENFRSAEYDLIN